MNASAVVVENLEALRRRKDMFDHTWTLAIVMSAASAIVFWYFGLGQIEISPIIWTLASLALVQFLINTRTLRCTSARQLRSLAKLSQFVGIAAMAVAWHLFGGIQQPTFPLFILLPLFTGAVILDFWQQQMTMVMFLLVLGSGVLLSPDTNSFIAERYGLGVFSTNVLPAWIPRSHPVFLDVSTSPTYNLMLTGSLALLALALNAISRAIVAMSLRSVGLVDALRQELDEAHRLNTSMVENSPASEVLVAQGSGRILHASDRFARAFGLQGGAAGQFLLDTVAFAYPIVIKRLITTGGEEIQGATVQGRDVVLRLRAGIVDSGANGTVRLSLEACDDICWRGAADAVDQPIFAVNSRGRVIFLNRSALALFGPGADGSEATDLFDKGIGANRWWDIAPLETTKRVLRKDQRSYLAAIRRRRIAESIGELAYIQLTEREVVRALATS